MIFGVKLMWTRKELKSNAKIVLKRSYWESLAAYIISIVLVGVASSLIAFIPVLGGFGSLAVSIFLASPITVGLYYYILQTRQSRPVIRNIFFAFNEVRYMPVVGAMAWQYLFMFLWSLIPAFGGTIFAVNLMVKYFSNFHNIRVNISGLFSDPSMVVVAVLCGIIIIAGSIVVLIKGISYSMTPFILANNPNIGYARALKLSIQMTHGQKWSIFVLMLSFIGWVLLSVLTLFIGMLFLTPYILATYGELYLKLRENALKTGLCTPAEFNITMTQ